MITENDKKLLHPIIIGAGNRKIIGVSEIIKPEPSRFLWRDVGVYVAGQKIKGISELEYIPSSVEEQLGILSNTIDTLSGTIILQKREVDQFIKILKLFSKRKIIRGR